MKVLISLSLVVLSLVSQALADCKTGCDAKCDALNQVCQAMGGGDCDQRLTGCKDFCTQGCDCVAHCGAGCISNLKSCAGDSPGIQIAELCLSGFYACADSTCPAACAFKFADEANAHMVQAIMAEVKKLEQAAAGSP